MNTVVFKAFTLLMCVWSINATAQSAIYQWIDENGNVHYSQDGSHQQARKVIVTERNVISAYRNEKQHQLAPKSKVANSTKHSIAKSITFGANLAK